MRNNRTAGHNWERECVKRLRDTFPNIVTSRSESKSRDDAKVDLMNRDEVKNGRLPYNFQCKNVVGKVDYISLLDEMPKENINVILHKSTIKKGKRFYERGSYAILKMDEFFALISKIKL